MKQLFLSAFLLCALAAHADPLVFQGVLQDGALVLKKADAEFMKLIEDIVQTAHSEASLRRVVDAIASTVPKDNAVAVIFSPVMEGGTSLLMNAVGISESIAEDFKKNGEALLKLDLTPVTSSAERSVLATDMLSVLGGLTRPLDAVPRLREAVAAVSPSSSDRHVELLDRVRTAFYTPVALLENSVEGFDSVQKTISQLVPVEFGPLFTLNI